jgi:hypothetical protein
MPLRKPCSHLTTSSLLLFAIGAPLCGAVPLDGEFQINLVTAGVQFAPSVAVAPDGRFIVVWKPLNGVFGQRFDSAGGRVGVPFQLNTYTVGSNHNDAKVAVDGDGDFVALWQNTPQDGSFNGIFGQLFASSGTKLGAEFQVNTFVAGNQMYSALAMDGDGDFVVVWHSYGQDEANVASTGVFAQRFSSSGTPLAAEFQVNTYSTGHQRTAQVGVETNGDFVVVWDSQNDADGSFGIRGQRFDSGGARIGLEFAVNSHTTNGQYGAAVAMDADGDFVVVWTSGFQEDPVGRGVFAQRYSSSGTRLGGEFQVNTHTLGSQYTHSPYAAMAPRVVAKEADGDFVVAWTGSHDGSNLGVFGQRFDSAGARIGVEFQVNTYTGGSQAGPAVAIEPASDFVVVWTANGQDGSSFGTFGRRFAFGDDDAIAIDVDLDGAVEPLSDGLLILRRLFGFSGAALVTGAFDAGNCQRCDASAMAAHIDSILSLLDIDLSGGPTQPLTDGLLILRRLFGFSGAALVTGAFDAGNCQRCDAGAMAAYIDGLAM